MTVLLDTHIFFWWITGSDRLPSNHGKLLEDGEENIFVSAATGWELAIKVKIGKWPAAAPLLPELEKTIRDEGFGLLDITLGQAKLAGSLELVCRDPFDRLLAAQSLSRDIPIATIDPAFKLLGARVV